MMYKIKRYNDGFKDILNKLIQTLKQYIEKFKQLDSNKKIVVLLNKALQSAIAISMAKNAIEIKKNLKSLKYWGDKINQEKSRNPDYEPSADNIYYKRQAQIIAKGSAMIVKMIAIIVSNKFEKKIINNENNPQDTNDMIITHDSMPWCRRKHNDYLEEYAATLGALLIAGLASVITKAVIKARMARQNKELEQEYIEKIRSGKITEDKYVRDMIFQIKRAIDRLYFNGDLDPYFKYENIPLDRSKKYIKKIKNDISKCKTVAQLINYLDSNSPIHHSFFDGLEFMDRMFKKARMKKDSYRLRKHKDDALPKSFSFKPSSSPELSSLSATQKALSDPNHVWDI